MPEHGVDVSSYQGGSIDWGSVMAAGYGFGIIKATEGTFYQDADFGVNWAGMQAAGSVRLAYHLCHPELSDPETECDYFIAWVEQNGDWSYGDGAALDCEMGSGDELAWMLRWIARFQERKGFLPMFYSRLSFMQVTNLVGSEQLAQCGLWLASYQANKPAPVSPWPFIAVWQSGQGSVSGIPGPVDLDTFYGSLDQLRLYGLQAPPAPPTPVPTNDDLEQLHRLVDAQPFIPTDLIAYAQPFVPISMVSKR